MISNLPAPPTAVAVENSSDRIDIHGTKINRTCPTILKTHISTNDWVEFCNQLDGILYQRFYRQRCMYLNRMVSILFFLIILVLVLYFVFTASNREKFTIQEVIVVVIVVPLIFVGLIMVGILSQRKMKTPPHEENHRLNQVCAEMSQKCPQIYFQLIHEVDTEQGIQGRTKDWGCMYIELISITNDGDHMLDDQCHVNEDCYVDATVIYDENDTNIEQ